MNHVYREYYTAALRYEFYFRAVKTIFYERAQRVSKILLFTTFCTNDSVRAGIDVIDILTSEDMENTPLESWMYFRMKFTSGKTLSSI